MLSISLNDLLALSKQQMICYTYLYVLYAYVTGESICLQGGLLEARLELAQRAAKRFPPRQGFSHQKASLTSVDAIPSDWGQINSHM